MKCTCHFQQMPGVFRSFCSYVYDLIITGSFSLNAELSRRQPHKRIKPINRARDLRDHLSQTIATFDMRQFVDKNNLSPLLGPFIRVCRKKDCRIDNTASDGHRETRRLQQLNRPHKPNLPCDIINRVQPMGVIDSFGPPSDPPDAHRAYKKPNNDKQSYRQPYAWHQDRKSVV